jgi:lysine decarboxylase
MYRAFEVLPTQTLIPHEAHQALLRGKTKTVRIADMINQTSAVMILPYPPGIPLIMPGETVTETAKEVLDYLLLLQDLGRAFPGFEADVHGVVVDAEGFFTVKVIAQP